MKTSANLSLLDAATAAAIALAVLFVFIAVPAPFMRSLLAAAILGALYGHASRQPDLVQICCLLPPLYMLGWFADYGISQITPHTIDRTLAMLDHGSGIAVWHWFQSHPTLQRFFHFIYYSLGAAIVWGFAISDRRRQLAHAMLLGAMAGLVCYWLFPAVGPIWVGQPHAIRNCMPSLHLTWALLIWLYAAPGLWRRLAFTYAVATTAATLATGEHYLVDLAAALPFTAAVLYVVSFSQQTAAQLPPPPPLAAATVMEKVLSAEP